MKALGQQGRGLEEVVAGGLGCPGLGSFSPPLPSLRGAPSRGDPEGSSLPPLWPSALPVKKKKKIPKLRNGATVDFAYCLEA